MILTVKFSFDKPDVSDKEIIEYINQRKNIITISFISPYNGIPHMCSVWGVFVNGKFYFQSEDYTSKIKSIKKGFRKIGISIVDSHQYPDYLEGSIPYISLGGSVKIRTKDKFAAFEEILREIFTKYIEDEKERKKVTNFVLEEVKTRVLIEIVPEWVKAVKVPKNVS
jgi:hypothetical protein